MDQKIGVYICSGCGIGESIDVEALSGVANEFKIAKTESHPTLCSEEGAGLIRNDIESGAVNCVVAAACSGRVKTDVFAFDPMTTILERLNIREHVAWCQPAGAEDTQMMAEDYMRMAITRVEKSTLPKPYQEAADKTVLVVGGGVSGLQASLDAARAGYSVMLVEKEPDLGGHMAKWHKTTPTGPPYQEIEEITVQEAADLVRAESAIAVHTGTTIEKISGAPGMFDVTLANGGGTHKVGSIVLAAGMKPYDAYQTGASLGTANSPMSLPMSRWKKWPRLGRSLALPTVQSPRSLHSSSARAPAIRTICRTAAQSAAGFL